MSSFDPITVVTLWRHGWTDSQGAVMRWLQGETWPRGTQFLWTAATDSPTEEHLERAIGGFPRVDLGFELKLAPDAPPKTNIQKHALVAGLYNAILPEVRTPNVLFVEDENVPRVGDLSRLGELYQSLPTDGAALMGAYRSRYHCDEVSASKDGVAFPWDKTYEEAILEAHWIGGGFTLYDTNSVLKCLPLIPEIIGTK